MQKLLDEMERTKPKKVIVEGESDRECLEFLGFEDVTVLYGPLYKVVEEFEGDEVVILTDLDSAGKRLYSILAKDFWRHGVKVNNSFREMLFQTSLKEIEGLKNFLRRKLLSI